MITRLILALVCIASCGTDSALAASSPEVTTVTFTESTEIQPNPERGFYRAGHGDLDRLQRAQLDATYAAGFRLVYARINLDRFRASPLPKAYLNRLNAGFAAARQSGIKLIVRAVYNYPAGETEYRDAKDAPLPIVLGHLNQLAPVLRDNADVIAFVQAGFVGAWGEWHTSSNGLTQPLARVRIKDALLAAVPQDRFVQFRYPPYIREWTATLPGASDPARGFRIGFHNDCFLASQTDVGTFSENARDRAVEQDHMDRLGDVGPFGGETCNPADAPGAQSRARCADILREGARYNLTYLNDGYYRRLFHDGWIAGGCMDNVARSMGYRLRLLAASHRIQADAGQSLGLSITVRNEGWARVFNPRRVEILLRARATGAVVRIPATVADPRNWLPGSDSRVGFDVAVPKGVRAGAYDLLIALPDAHARLRNDPRYSIRPANAEDGAKGQGWDAGLGAFRLGTTIRIARHARS